ncbi:MAG: hypothetical protein ACKVS6_10965, partial [Planctomycetota bacterium]
LVNDVNLMRGQAANGNSNLVAHGLIDGERRGFIYNPPTQTFTSDKSGVGPFSFAQLQTKAQSGTAILTFLSVPSGSGTRIGVDRDLDGVPDGDEAPIQHFLTYGASTGSCLGGQHIAANSLPTIGNELFTFTCTNAPALSLGLCLIGDAQDTPGSPFYGVNLFISPLSTEVFALDFNSDGLGTGFAPIAIPNDTNLIGRTYYAQALWGSVCGQNGISASDALSVLIAAP